MSEGQWYQGFHSGGQAAVAAPVATRPTPPTAYSVPAGTSVSTSSGLAAALAATTPATIIVEDGVYTHTGVVTVGAAHQVYAANLLGAELQFGLVGGQFADTAGLLLRGLYFNVSSSANCFGGGAGGILVAWAGGSSGWQILDCVLHGTDSITNGLSIQSNACYEGLVVRRCEVRDFHSNGLRVDSNDTSYVPTVAPILEDIYTENCVYKTAPGDSNGVAEAGLWLGCKATVSRCWFHQDPDYASYNSTRDYSKAWQGLWLGTATQDMTITDIFVSGYIAFGCYGYGPINADDVSTLLVQRMETVYPVNVGFHLEWNNPSAAHDPNIQNVICEDCYFESQSVGWDADTGTVNSTVRDTVFVGQLDAAINSYTPGANMLYDVSGNDYSGIDGGADEVGTTHAPDLPHWNHDLEGYGE